MPFKNVLVNLEWKIFFVVELCEIFPLQVTLTFATDLTAECINFGSCRNHYFTSFLDQIFIIGTKIYLSEDFQKILLKTAETANLKS